MSTLEEIPLQHAGGKEVENRSHVTLTEPLEQDDTIDNTQETSSSGEGTAGQVVKSRWETVFTTVTTLLATSLLNAGISMIAPFYPIVAQQYNVAVYIVGFVIGMAPLCVTVTSPLVGYLLPHLGLKFTQLAGLFLAGGSLILFGFVSIMPSTASFVVFSFLLRTVEGVGTGMYFTASYTQLTRFYPDKKATIIGLIELSLVLGIALGPAVGGGLQEAGGFLLPFLVVGSFIVALMVLLAVLIRPTECVDVKLPWRLVLRLFTNIVFVLIVASLLLSIANIYANFTYFGKYLHRQFNLRVGLIGVVYLASTTAYGVCTIIVGPITDRLKTPRYLMMIGLVVTAVGCVFLGPAKFITTPKLWLSILADAILGVGLALLVIPVYPDMYGIAKSLHTGESETVVASLVSGIFVGTNSAGECVGAVVGGAMVYGVGFRRMAAILGLVLLVCALVLVIVTVVEKCLKFNRSKEL